MGGLSKAFKKVVKIAASPYTYLASEATKAAGLDKTIVSKIADPLGLFKSKVSSGPMTPQEIKSMTGLGAVGEGGGTTFDESETKRKAVRKKKLGARGLQIPLQSTSTDVSSGIASTTSGTVGIQI